MGDFEAHGPREEIMRLRCAVRGLEEAHKENGRRMKQMLGFYREMVKAWREEGKEERWREVLVAYRLCIRTMLGMEG